MTTRRASTLQISPSMPQREDSDHWESRDLLCSSQGEEDDESSEGLYVPAPELDDATYEAQYAFHFDKYDKNFARRAREGMSEMKMQEVTWGRIALEFAAGLGGMLAYTLFHHVANVRGIYAAGWYAIMLPFPFALWLVLTVASYECWQVNLHHLMMAETVRSKVYITFRLTTSFAVAGVVTALLIAKLSWKSLQYWSLPLRVPYYFPPVFFVVLAIWEYIRGSSVWNLPILALVRGKKLIVLKSLEDLFILMKSLVKDDHKEDHDVEEEDENEKKDEKSDKKGPLYINKPYLVEEVKLEKDVFTLGFQGEDIPSGSYELTGLRIYKDSETDSVKPEKRVLRWLKDNHESKLEGLRRLAASFLPCLVPRYIRHAELDGLPFRTSSGHQRAFVDSKDVAKWFDKNIKEHHHGTGDAQGTAKPDADGSILLMSESYEVSVELTLKERRRPLTWFGFLFIEHWSVRAWIAVVLFDIMTVPARFLMLGARLIFENQCYMKAGYFDKNPILTFRGELKSNLTPPIASLNDSALLANLTGGDETYDNLLESIKWLGLSLNKTCSNESLGDVLTYAQNFLEEVHVSPVELGLPFILGVVMVYCFALQVAQYEQHRRQRRFISTLDIHPNEKKQVKSTDSFFETRSSFIGSCKLWYQYFLNDGIVDQLVWSPQTRSKTLNQALVEISNLLGVDVGGSAWSRVTSAADFNALVPSAETKKPNADHGADTESEEEEESEDEVRCCRGKSLKQIQQDLEGKAHFAVCIKLALENEKALKPYLAAKQKQEKDQDDPDEAVSAPVHLMKDRRSGFNLIVRKPETTETHAMAKQASEFCYSRLPFESKKALTAKIGHVSAQDGKAYSLTLPKETAANYGHLKRVLENSTLEWVSYEDDSGIVQCLKADEMKFSLLKDLLDPHTEGVEDNLELTFKVNLDTLRTALKNAPREKDAPANARQQMQKLLDEIKRLMELPDGRGSDWVEVWVATAGQFNLERSNKSSILTRQLLIWFTIPVVSILVALVVPFVRHYQDGNGLFGATWIWSCVLCLNTMTVAFMMACFLYLFTTTTLRLWFAVGLLEEFEQFTINPSLQDPDESHPFDLTLSMTSKDLKPLPYLFWTRDWREGWQKVIANIEQWQRCQKYLRIFVSSVRLVAQAVLVAAAVVLGFLLVTSIISALQGKGVLQIDPEKLKNATADALHKHRALSASVGAGGRILTEVSKAAVAAARRLEPEVPLSHAAAIRLHSLLHPHFDLLDEPLYNQLEALPGTRRLDAEKSISDMYADLQNSGISLGSMDKIAKSQVLTAVMAVVILLYTVPLIFYIAKINRLISQQEDHVAFVEGHHRSAQAAREREIDAKALGPDLKLAIDSKFVREVVDTPADPNAGNKDAPSSSRPAAPTAQAPTTQAKKILIPDSSKDEGLQLYEKALKGAKEASHYSAITFPLTLFGFVITFPILGVWSGMAVSPTITQIEQMAPKLVMQTCNAIKKELKKTEDTITSAGAPPLKLRKLLDDAVCKPMLAKLDQTLKAAKEAQKKATGRRRRLQPVGSMESTIMEWWHSTKGAPEDKLSLVQMVLAKYERRAHRRMVEAPSAIARLAEHAPWEHVVEAATMALSHTEEPFLDGDNSDNLELI